MTLVFARNAWTDYQYWLENDRKLLSRINALIRECQRSPFAGVVRLPELASRSLSDTLWQVIGPDALIRSTGWSIALLTANCG